MEYILYHASVESFTNFDENKIRECETDAPFNGFWFSSDKRTSSAWVNPKYLKTCKIILKNPCTWEVIYNLTKGDRFRYNCTELRKKLLKMGYDGIVFKDKPTIDKLELKETGETTFKTARGKEYKLKLENGGLNLYDRNECITGYYNLEDYLENEETVIVTFTTKNIKILEEIQNPYWN